MAPTRGWYRAFVSQALPKAIAFVALVPWAFASALSAQASDPAAAEAATRIWGRVITVDGLVHEGFLRWDRNEVSWVDLLNGSKLQEWVESEDWSPESGSARAADRVIEIAGYRITWDDSRSDQPTTAESGLRFGHVRSIRISGDDSLTVELRSGGTLALNERSDTLLPGPGLTVILEGGSTDLGSDMRGLQVDVPGGEMVELEWEDLASVELGPAPEGARPRSPRLHGTVEDRWGNRYTGFLSFDSDASLASDTLEGSTLRGREHRMLWGELAEVHRSLLGAEVILTRGDTLRLVESAGGSFYEGQWQVSDPGLGQVDISWDDLEVVRFHPPGAGAPALAYQDFRVDPLRGTVVTVTGAELTGLIRWDADETFSWEILDGRRNGVTFDVEMGEVAAIERLASGRTGPRGVRVTLRDGRTLELSGSNDVDSQNKGIFVLPEEADATGGATGNAGASGSGGATWIRVRWPDFQSIRFHQGGESW